MIKECSVSDKNTIFEIINDAAAAYKGVIPEDRWHEPYMPLEELDREIKEGVVFWGYYEANILQGVMGIQNKGDVDLIRHAYVKTNLRGKGIGSRLLSHIESTVSNPVLIGTWAAAEWAIKFYEKNGYTLVPRDEVPGLLRKYWNIPDRQVETSVVLRGNV